jgi:threonylcarbamoyladenosine tRNA methylthiotransferase MtaB
MTLSTLTFGCRLNAAESVAIEARARSAGLDDAIVVNTCAVTGEAVRQAKQAIRRARREHPERRIVVTGCAAQTEPETFAAMPEVDLVLGNAEKFSTQAYRVLAGTLREGLDAPRRIRVSDIFALRETAAHRLDGFGDRCRAFVQVQNGCAHRCTFCIIPYGRGNSRSVPMDAIGDEIRRVVARGYNEVVLTGVDITSYGVDLPGQPRLGALVRNILKLVPELSRLRLSSIDSAEADDDLYRALAEEGRLMPHLHLSLQSGDDMILKRMKRRHSRADAIRFTERARKIRPDLVLGADFIAGFPTESDAMFENTRSIVDECGLTFLHVFPFSPREGTPAERMPQLPTDLIRSRAKVLREKGDATLTGFLSGEIGRIRSVLVENGGVGHTEHYAPVAIEGARPGTIVSARISATDGRRLSVESFQKAA